MDLLSQLLGGVKRQTKGVTQATGQAAQNIQGMSQQMPANRATPGYEQQAAAYEQAMRSGDMNSPAIIGVDPKNFGYAPDPTVRPPQQQGFRMYEDRSFQGDPRQFMQQNPGYKFFEDNTFSPPDATP